MQELVDTHCHIQSIGKTGGDKTTSEKWSKASDLTADGVVASASEEGVTRLICVGCDLNDSHLAVDFAKNRANCWASVGIHPHEAKKYSANGDHLKEFEQLLSQPKVIAIGECGLDYYYEHSSRESQAVVLKTQIKLALTQNLPLIFHVRDAYEDFWTILEEFSGIRGVLHSFTDTADNLSKALNKGLLIGVNGIATFSKDPILQEVYRQIPLQNLLLESDAPFLTPAPYRGTINEPKRVGVVADFLADLRGENRDRLAEATTNNALNLFGI